MTASFGVAAKGVVESAEELVAAADEALYEAKRAGKTVSPGRASQGGATLEIPPLERRTRPGKPAPAPQPPRVVKKEPAKQPAARRKPASKPKT